MKILKFHIVGLTHNDVKNCEVQYAKEAVGKTLCLVPDDANPFDLLAVKAYEGQKSIGFVSALEVEDVRAAIIASGDSSLRTRCVACDSKEENGKTGLYLEVKALVDATDEEIEQARIKIYDDRMYEDWHYTGPIYTIDKLVRFSDSTLMLEGVIDRIIKIQKQLAGKDAGENGQAGEMMAMKAVGAKPSNEVKKEKFMELVDLVIPKIAVYKKNGCPELLVKRQSDWFPVFRLLNGWGLFNMGTPTAFCKHLAHLYEKIPPENTGRAPLCKWKDLAQVKSDPFEYAALEWWKLSSDKLGSVSLERFNHYCDIVNVFKKILGATAFLENVDLKEILPKQVDKEVPDSDTKNDDEMTAEDGS